MANLQCYAHLFFSIQLPHGLSSYVYLSGIYWQVMRIADKGADIVRITVQGKKEADACFEIKNTLVQKK